MKNKKKSLSDDELRIFINKSDFCSLKVEAFMGETPLEVAEKVMTGSQVVFKIPETDTDFIIVSSIPSTPNFLVRYKSNGQIFKNSAEASLCFVDVVRECLDTFFGEDNNKCLPSAN